MATVAFDFNKFQESRFEKLSGTRVACYANRSWLELGSFFQVPIMFS